MRLRLALISWLVIPVVLILWIAHPAAAQDPPQSSSPDSTRTSSPLREEQAQRPSTRLELLRSLYRRETELLKLVGSLRTEVEQCRQRLAELQPQVLHIAQIEELEMPTLEDERKQARIQLQVLAVAYQQLKALQELTKQSQQFGGGPELWKQDFPFPKGDFPIAEQKMQELQNLVEQLNGTKNSELETRKRGRLNQGRFTITETLLELFIIFQEEEILDPVQQYQIALSSLQLLLNDLSELEKKLQEHEAFLALVIELQIIIDEQK